MEKKKNIPKSNMDIRMRMLHSSLIVERLTAAFLAGLIGINNHGESITLSNKGSALSFNQKVNLLIDMGALNKEDKKKFDMFMSIRNQFMHNFEANTYGNCVGFIEGCSGFLLKTYKKQIEEGGEDAPISMEDKLSFAIFLLCEDVHDLTNSIIEKVKIKHSFARLAKEKEYVIDVIIESIQSLATVLNERPDLIDYTGQVGDQMYDLFMKLVEHRIPMDDIKSAGSN